MSEYTLILSWLAAMMLPLCLVLWVTPKVILFAKSIGAMDEPNERKVHHVAIPRFGGVGILLALIISFPLLYLGTPLLDGILEHQKQIIFMSLALFTLFVLGIMDDLRSLNPGLKFAVQFLVAGLVYAAGFSISAVTHPWGEGMIPVGMLDLPLTLLWIVGITNAFNLIDGLDGLASGVATIACLSIFAVSLFAGDMWTATFVLVMAGALVGFLRYNFNPARIFLGDSGSLMIGFFLAVISIQSTTKISTGFTLLFPVLVLILPIADTLISMVRRFLGSFLYEREHHSSESIFHKIHGMFTPDRSHIHHQLLSLGLSHRTTVLILYAVSAFFATGALLFTQAQNSEQIVALLFLTGLALILGIKHLRYYEISIFQNGLILPLYEKWVIKRTGFLGLFDALFVAVSYLLAVYFTRTSGSFTELIRSEASILLLVVPVQLSIFWITGLYRGRIRQPGIGNALAIISSITYAVIGSTLMLMVFSQLALGRLVPFLFVHFYLLLTTVLGIRMFHLVLSFWFNRYKRTGTQVLIYGANENGIMILHKLTHSPRSRVKVIGFLDDNPDMEGKQMYGYPIMGGHWKLDRILKNHSVEAIYLCEDQVKPEDFKRFKKIAGHYGVELRKLHIELEQVVTDRLDRQGVSVQPLSKRASLV